jgi:hypothetical protein
MVAINAGFLVIVLAVAVVMRRPLAWMTRGAGAIFVRHLPQSQPQHHAEGRQSAAEATQC